MLQQSVSNFLKKAHTDAALADQVTRTDSYQALAELSEQAGEPATVSELRAAFTARNAARLVRQMVDRGVIEPVPLPALPGLDPDLWQRVAGMDLRPMVMQFVHQKQWTLERARATEQRYRRFFYMMVALPECAVPTLEIDEFWHQHIINTRQYAPDCERVAGEFLHHNFYTLEAPEQTSEHWAAWIATWVCYETLFEEPYEETIGAALLQRWPQA